MILKCYYGEADDSHASPPVCDGLARYFVPRCRVAGDVVEQVAGPASAAALAIIMVRAKAEIKHGGDAFVGANVLGPRRTRPGPEV